MHSSSYLGIGTFNFFEFGDYEKAKSLIVHAKASRWADAEAYNAAIYYYWGSMRRWRLIGNYSWKPTAN